jgi:MarR family transcriptional regulator, organic hydroperoxide resistance regulator
MAATATLARKSGNSAAAAELIDSVHEVMKTVIRHAQPDLEAEGISMGQFWTMHLVTSLNSATVGAVSRGLAVSAPSVCASLDQLEESGLVTRRRSAKDRREVEVSLTPRGKKVEARMWAQISRLLAEASVDVPLDDLETATRVFRAVRRQLNTWPSPPEVAA